MRVYDPNPELDLDENRDAVQAIFDALQSLAEYRASDPDQPLEAEHVWQDLMLYGWEVRPRRTVTHWQEKYYQLLDEYREVRRQLDEVRRVLKSR